MVLTILAGAILLGGVFYFFFPKRVYVGYRDGACYSDRCLGILKTPCTSTNYLGRDSCYRVCYGYAYNKCDNRYLPISLLRHPLKFFLGLFGLKWAAPAANIIR